MARMPHRKKMAFITSSSHSAALWGLLNFRITMAPEAESCCFIVTPMDLVEKAACSQKPPGNARPQAESIRIQDPGVEKGASPYSASTRGTAPARRISSAASELTAKSMKACAASDSSAESLVMKLKGRWTL